MGSHNHNKAITHLAMPERQIPVLIDSSPDKAEGYVSSMTWSGVPVSSVRRLMPAIVEDLRSPRRRKEIEKDYGAIDEAEWRRLLEMLALLNRLNAGDWSPIISTNSEKLAEQLFAKMKRLNPDSRWWIDNYKPGTGKFSFRSISGDKRTLFSLEIDLGKPTFKSIADSPAQGESRLKPVAKLNDRIMDGTIKRSAEKSIFDFGGIYKNATFALSEAFTAGMSKARFVIWWSAIAKKFVPGLYCPDIMTALYALVLSSAGTPGGVGVCEKCQTPFIRSRADQIYCKPKCQAAAGMKRYRERKPTLKTRAQGEKGAGRK